MTRDYHKWWSHALRREMELLVFGSAGHPVLVFPTSRGRFWDYEERGMVEAASPAIDAGKIRLICLDSVDAESWYDKQKHPSDRARRQSDYDRYLSSEVLPFAQRISGCTHVAVTGCSFGGYHSMNFALRHPWHVNAVISMGGAFDMTQFLDGYFDEHCYYQSPPAYLPGLEDPRYLDPLRRMPIVLATGETDICLGENQKLSGILQERQIPHWLDIWRDGTGHDWQWWRAMAGKFFVEQALFACCR